MNHTQTNFKFDGTARDLFFIYLKNFFFTIITLGIYSFWARVNTKKYLYERTMWEEGRFAYHATGKELLLGFLKGLLIMLPVFIIPYALLLIFVVPNHPNAIYVFFAYFYLLLFISLPYLICGSQRFALARTSWNNVRFHFEGTGKELAKSYFKWLLLTIVTFGIYFAWAQAKLQAYLIQKSFVGSEKFDFKGKGDELFWIYFKGTLLSIITLGVYSFWYLNKLNKYVYENTLLQGKSIRYSVTGGCNLSQPSEQFL